MSRWKMASRGKIGHFFHLRLFLLAWEIKIKFGKTFLSYKDLVYPFEGVSFKKSTYFGLSEVTVS